MNFLLFLHPTQFILVFNKLYLLLTPYIRLPVVYLDKSKIFHNLWYLQSSFLVTFACSWSWESRYPPARNQAIDSELGEWVWKRSVEELIMLTEEGGCEISRCSFTLGLSVACSSARAKPNYHPPALGPLWWKLCLYFTLITFIIAESSVKHEPHPTVFHENMSKLNTVRVV